MFLWLLGNILASLAIVFLFHYAYKQLQDSFTTPETITVATMELPSANASASANANANASASATPPESAAKPEPAPDMASILRSHVQGLNNSFNATPSGSHSTDIECLPKRE